jgi:hypothetical protein
LSELFAICSIDVKPEELKALTVGNLVKGPWDIQAFAMLATHNRSTPNS